jgi:hypothetical protein
MATAGAGAWAYARAAANRLVGGTAQESVVRGVLSQWIAESGWGWPPLRRNPGNLARGWAKGLGYPFSVQTPNPQPSNPIVTFATLKGGAYAYADGLRAYPRYNTAQALATKGDGLGFAVAVCRAGYGTNEATVKSVYALLGNPPKPSVGYRVTTARVYLRTGAGTAYRAIELLGIAAKLVTLAAVRGGAYTVNGQRRTDWYRVRAPSGKTGYVAAAYTKAV